MTSPPRRQPRDRLVPALRKGTVTAVADETVDVDLTGNGADSATPMGWVGDRPLDGQVVSVLHVFGSALVLGQTSPDVWHTVGAAGEPAFGGTWGHVSGTQKAAFRLSRDGVEFSGAVGATGTATSGSTIFTLPTGYVPDAVVRWTISANVAAGNNAAVTLVVQPIGSGNPGAVQIQNFSGAVQWGAVGLSGLWFPLIGAP